MWIQRGGWPHNRNGCTTGFTLNQQSGQSKGLVGWWPYNDASGYNYVTQSFWTAVTGTRPTLGPGRGKLGIYFSGITNFLYRYLDHWLHGVGYPATVSFWADIQSGNRRGSLFKVGNLATGWGIGVGNASWNVLGVDIIGLYENVAWIPFGVNYPSNRIAFWTMTVSSSRVPKLYIDGILQSTKGTNNILNPVTDLYIGGYSTRKFTGGRMSDIRLYNRELHSGEVWALYSDPGALYAPAVSDGIGSESAAVGSARWIRIGEGLRLI